MTIVNLVSICLACVDVEDSLFFLIKRFTGMSVEPQIYKQYPGEVSRLE